MPVTRRAEEDGYHNRPYFLPHGRHFLFDSLTPPPVRVWLGDLSTGEAKELIRDSRTAMYVDPGYILYAEFGSNTARLTGTLFARRFDLDRLVFDGEPLTVAPGVRGGPLGDGYSVSATNLVYHRPTFNEHAWMDRAGNRLDVPEPSTRVPGWTVDLAPSGRALAFGARSRISYSRATRGARKQR